MRNMDILADYRTWAASREERVGTHSGRCHMWHKVCMIVRLARELERLQAENADYRREVREQRREIAGLREERAMLLGADRTPGADATPGEGSVQALRTNSYSDCCDSLQGRELGQQGAAKRCGTVRK